MNALNRTEIKGLSDTCFVHFAEMIHNFTGITIAQNRKMMLQGRFRKRIKELHLDDFESYLSYVKKNPEEKEVLINLVTTNETSFFRTPRIWTFFENNLLPNFHKHYPNQVFRAWSAAASSGEEAHSLGIICEAFKHKIPDFNYQILGTDISQEMITRCQRGIYQGRSIESFQQRKPEYFKSYLHKHQDGYYQVKSEVKSRLKFKQHNLFDILKQGEKFDLILVRNVLMYFSLPDQAKVVSNLNLSLKNDGFMVIGESETLAQIRSDLRLIEPLIYTGSSSAQGCLI